MDNYERQVKVRKTHPFPITFLGRVKYKQDKAEEDKSS